MMMSYARAYITDNKVKTSLIIISLSIYFAAVSLAVTLRGSIDDVASLPMKNIGAETVVQKNGKIPNRMTDAIFPHSNAPIYPAEISRIISAPFVTGHDKALYFWYFDSNYFKSALGADLRQGIYADNLKNSLVEGVYPSSPEMVLATEDFTKKNSLLLNDLIVMGDASFVLSGILRSQFNGNIAPADIYMDISQAQAVAGKSAEMTELYGISDTDFYNMLVLKTDPQWQGDREQVIRSFGDGYLVFGDQSFKKEISDQLVLLSSSAAAVFAVLGGLLAAGFSLMIYYGIKTRENEIALLRMLGWRFSSLRNQFVGEGGLLALVSLMVGNLIYLCSFFYLSGVQVTMELPWDVSAKPHFLPAENNIERVITAPLPMNFDILPHLGVNLLMLGGCVMLTFFVLFRLRHIKPSEFYKG